MRVLFVSELIVLFFYNINEISMNMSLINMNISLINMNIS